MSLRISILLLLLLPSLVMGQVFSSKGRFSVEFDKGCNPMTVNITEHDAFGDITRQYFYEENANITNSKTYTYVETKVYNIIQVIGVDNQGSKFDTLQVEVFDSIKPIINIEKCSGNEVSVKSNDNRYDFIRVYFGGADSVQLNLNETTTYTFVTSSVQSIGLKGFFINADENCSEYFEEVVPIPSLPTPLISTVSIKETCKGIYSLYLELDSYDSLINYQIELAQINSNIVFEGKLKSNEILLSDIPFNISESNFCVQVNAIDPCNSTKIDGSQECRESSDLSLSPFQSLYSSYESNGVYINVDNIQSGTFLIYKRLENEEFLFEDSVSSSYTDAVISKSRKYFYKLEYVDSCNQILYTAETSPPFIETKILNQNSYTVSYSSPTNSLISTFTSNYIVGDENETSSNPVTSSEFMVNLDPKDGTQLQFINVQIEHSDGQIIKSNVRTLLYETFVHVPNAFTPNGDGLNDTLELFGLPSENVTTNIYTKWGHLIYTSNMPSPGWDGRINGEIATEGTYLYEIIFESTNGEKLQQKGTFALIKK